MKKPAKYKKSTRSNLKVEEPFFDLETPIKAKLSSSDIRSNEDIVIRSIDGVGIDAFDQLTSKYNIPIAQLAHFLGLSERTIRNYREQSKSFDPQQGEQLLKIQKLMSFGVQVFGDSEALARWLQKPAYGLNFRLPNELLVTSEGINLVIDEIERIALGDFS